MEWATFFDRSKKRVVNFLQYNFICLPKVSKNTERALKFLDWANQKDSYDLLAYGIEGKHWEPVGDDLYKQITTDYYWFPYAWIWNPTLERYNVEVGEEAIAWNKWSADANNFEADKLVGLNVNVDAVLDQATQLQALADQYLNQFKAGVADLGATWEEYKGKANDLNKAVIAEYQKQIDDFLAKKK